jgi:hypothetical protein
VFYYITQEWLDNDEDIFKELTLALWCNCSGRGGVVILNFLTAKLVDQGSPLLNTVITEKRLLPLNEKYR